MSDRDTITLPREVVEKAIKAFENGCPPTCENGMIDSGGFHPWGEPMLDLCPACLAFEHLRTALAAEQPKPEPVAWRPRLSPNLCFHWSRPWSPGVPSEQTVDYWNQKGAGVEYAYAAPPALAAEQPKHDLMKWAKDAGSSPEDLERFATYTIATRDMEIATLREENEALRRDVERYRWLRDNAAGFSGRTLDAITDAAIDAAMGDKT